MVAGTGWRLLQAAAESGFDAAQYGPAALPFQACGWPVQAQRWVSAAQGQGPSAGNQGTGRIVGAVAAAVSLAHPIGSAGGG